ncbi:hypothetical protein MTR67_001321 [Solanum verrucosum]|uniref:Uncharacterized protein n=1 Tax=Solanum verrucosum TaxID=315347 RepID=A0AAF0PNC7_SOLVR|nr:hypothetical protein MTR67_001321 [Solanum verrucosum]
MYGDMENGKHLNPWGGLWRSIIETRMFMGKIHFKSGDFLTAENMEKKRMLMCKPSEVRTIPVPHNEPIIVYFIELVRHGTLPLSQIFFQFVP